MELKLKIYFLAIISLMMVMLTACEKLVEVDTPANQLNSGNIYKDSVTAQSAVFGMYSKMYNGPGLGDSFYATHVNLLPGRSADELRNTLISDDSFIENGLVPGNTEVAAIWATIYNSIYNANAVIEGLTGASISNSLKQQLMGEAKFVRAFNHFYLVNYFGDIPLILTNDLRVISKMSRTPKAEVYAQIITDLKDAKAALPPDYSRSPADRSRVNKWAAGAMLARVYLYTQNWSFAEQEAAEVIGKSGLYNLPALGQVFLKPSKETIWHFPSNVRGFTHIANEFIGNSHSLTTSQIAAFERDPARPEYEDDRFTAWIRVANSISYPAKYKSRTNDNTENDVIMRLAEQYLIRAEARINLNKLDGAREDINAVRTRAGLINTPAANTTTALMTAVEHERQVELFAEWGHRWLDLKRWGRADAVLGPLKGNGWQATDILYPIPALERTNNPNLIQNDGY